MRSAVDNFEVEKVYGGRHRFDAMVASARSVNSLNVSFFGGAIAGNLSSDAIAVKPPTDDVLLFLLGSFPACFIRPFFAFLIILRAW